MESLSKAVSVECRGCKPDCRGSRRLLTLRERRMEEEGGRRSCEGIGSRGQVVRRASERILETSLMVVRSKVRSVGGGLQYEECRVGWKWRSEQWWGRGRGVMRV
ncbi:unnamed protein product [Staurois parvus]|uniref:Uncharacterized protein n=1 Tax=Staurois parvus TaxID=386267 RepID=A0ABN9BKP3_9NEOB|nr:unnamed protein product [Staurois parvus]